MLVESQRAFKNQWIRKFQSFEKQARKKLIHLHAAPSLRSLILIPENKFHSLSGDRKEQSINDQWRVCFEWNEGYAYNVEITDYH